MAGRKRRFNVSIIVRRDGVVVQDGAYGARVEDGQTTDCSERQAGLSGDAVAWLRDRFPHLTFELVRDGGDQYYHDLRASLGLPSLGKNNDE